MQDKQVRLSPQTHKLLMQYKVDTGMDIQTIVAMAVEREIVVGEWVITPTLDENKKLYICDCGCATDVVLGASAERMMNYCSNCGTKMKQEET